eukprot:scaffold61369_cov15-Tisochrysis_lutea.AAC.1
MKLTNGARNVDPCALQDGMKTVWPEQVVQKQVHLCAVNNNTNKVSHSISHVKKPPFADRDGCNIPNFEGIVCMVYPLSHVNTYAHHSIF